MENFRKLFSKKVREKNFAKFSRKYVNENFRFNPTHKAISATSHAIILDYNTKKLWRICLTVRKDLGDTVFITMGAGRWLLLTKYFVIQHVITVVTIQRQ
jgi:mevalonate pyrophosphate decarboxylase